MNKLIWSAFALSLIIPISSVFAQTEAIDDFLGLETEIMPDLKGTQKFTPEDLHTSESWKVTPLKTIVDLPSPSKGQGYSIIQWSTQDPYDFLSINKWLVDREIKDKTPDWMIRLRSASHAELVGKILQCSGTCYVYRGSNRAKVQHLSQVLEGDELVTEKDSVAWFYTMDGSIGRLAPMSSIAFQEINISPKEIFILTRLNQGHLYWGARSRTALTLDTSPETDPQSIPLLVKEANREHFERLIYNTKNDEQRVYDVTNLEEGSHTAQNDEINKQREANNQKLIYSSRIMTVTPNMSIVSKDVSFDLSYMPGGKSYFKKRSTDVDSEFSLYLRGYSNSDSHVIGSTDWHQVEVNGRGYSSISDVPAPLQVLELLTKRIKTFELAREKWITEFTLPVIADISNPVVLAKNHGYTAWGDELAERQEFLKEYTRRIETTHLRSLENLLSKIEANGKSVDRELTLDHYKSSVNPYLLGLKSRYDRKQMRVKEMNDLQYYVWILRNGKF